jgi:DNA-directed RNA polymerase specialized sigma24 family protein
LARQGLRFTAIAEITGLTPRQVAIRVNRVLPRVPRRELSRIYSLEQIRGLYAEHGSYAAVAKLIGCHWSTVRYHVART